MERVEHKLKDGRGGVWLRLISDGIQIEIYEQCVNTYTHPARTIIKKSVPTLTTP